MTEPDFSPERFAREYMKTNGFVGVEVCTLEDVERIYLDGFRDGTARLADVAQARDVAEEALKRLGYEIGVVKDVVTWVKRSST